MLGMAADLHDRLMCSCGCGQWEADAHDPATQDRWRVDYDVCYVRRAIDSFVKSEQPPNEAVLSVALQPADFDPKASGRAKVEELRAMMRAGSPTAAEPDHEIDGRGDDASE
jgi:hypothetical protein